MHAATIRFLLRILPGLTPGFLLLSLVLVHGEAPVGSKTKALVGGRILTQTDAGAIEGTILVRDGRIIAVGAQVDIPGDAERIDVTGYIITPGLIDARSTLWLNSEAARESAADAGLDVLDGVDPHEDDWKEVVRQGVTAVYVQPANSGILGGRGAVLRVGPAESVEELVVKSGAGLQAALGVTTGGAAAAAAAAAAPQVTPAQPATPAAPTSNALTRFSQYQQLKAALEAGKTYDEVWKKHEEAVKTKKAAKGAAAPKRDGAKDFLRQVLKGETPLRIEAHRDDDVRNALRLADDFHLPIVLEGVSSPRTSTESLVTRRVPLILGPVLELDEVPAYRKDRPADWPKALIAPETRWALGTFSSEPRGSRLLRVHAAAAVARGIASERVLRAMTRDAAEILGVADRLGVIAVGKQADLAVFAGDPLDPAVPVRLVLSQGKVVYHAQVAPAPAAARESGPLHLPARLPRQYALKTQRLVQEDGSFQPGMVLVDGGKVAGVGPSLSVSEGIPTYDLGSTVMSPGLVAGHSHLGFAGAIDDPAEADASQVRAADVFDPQQRQVRELLHAGCTSALFAPGSHNVLAGTVCGMRLAGSGAIPGDTGLKFVLAANSREVSTAADVPIAALGPLIRRLRGPSRYPGSLAGQVELVEQVLGGKAPGTELYLPPAIRQQLDNERRRHVAALLERKQVALFEAHTRAEVDAALQLIERFKLRAVLVGPEEVQPFLGAIKRLGVGIVARPTQEDDYDRSTQELAAAAAAGTPIAFDAESAHDPRLSAALAINAGMSREAAWRGLTTHAAQLAGLPPSAGRIVVGGPADLVVWDGSPLDLCSRPLRIIASGKIVAAP
jgi:imidazolonepropionase-like amidohydrolase